MNALNFADSPDTMNAPPLCDDITSVDSIIARVLDIDIDQVRDELSYQSISQWDSLRHVTLMLALEEAFGVDISADLMLHLHSVQAIRAFADGAAGAPVQPAVAASGHREPDPVVHRGLEGMYVDRSRITRIDGEQGVLEYRGYSIHELASYATFEETAYLLIHGELPDAAALAEFQAELASARQVPAPVMDIMRGLSHAHPMEALRTGVSALGAFDPDAFDPDNVAIDGSSTAGSLRAGVRLIAQVPVLIAAHHAARQGRELVTPPSGLSCASYFLYLLRGAAPSSHEVRLMDRDLIVHADHSSNASAFAARVVISCRAGIHAAVTAAISAFAGPLHGGAPNAS